MDAASALPTLKKQWNEGVAFSVDLLGEACVSDEEAAAYQRRYLDLVETLPATRGRLAGRTRCWKTTISARSRGPTSRSRSARSAPGPTRSTSRARSAR